MSSYQQKIANLPAGPGVYLMKNTHGNVIYVGRSSSLKKRVSSYFNRAVDQKTAILVAEIAKVDYQQTDSVLEATILEAQLIKKYQPKYNIKAKDDKSFLYIVITEDEYPKVLIKRSREIEHTSAAPTIGNQNYHAVIGPFTNRHLVRSILKLIRKMFPWSNCEPPKIKPLPRSRPPGAKGKQEEEVARGCFYYHLGQCPGVCTGEISKTDYQKIIRNLILFFQGQKQQLIKRLNKEMTKLSAQEKFEEAAKLRNQLYYLQHIQDIGLIKREEEGSAWLKRIEGYDISNISGKQATGSLVVFENGQPNKNEYRRFKIKTIPGANDPAMLTEVIQRRFRHREWANPDLILVDGGQTQVNSTVEQLKTDKLTIPVVGIAKGSRRQKTKLIFGPMETKIRENIKRNQNILIQIRDEAHRFALNYHRKLRNVKN